MATTTHNSESREVRELTERELNDDAVSGGSFVWEAELNPVSGAAKVLSRDGQFIGVVAKISDGTSNTLLIGE